MSNDLIVLAVTAVSIGFLHTLFGPDHYFPFIILAKTRNWSMVKTSWITFICGIGHILGSVVLALLGLLIGVTVNKLVNIESARGEIASWLLIAFGLIYALWGIKQAAKNKLHAHEHVHVHEDGTAHSHGHFHLDGPEHIDNPKKKSLTPWVLFIIFVLGPCEPLIPLVMYPSAKGNIPAVLTVVLVFGTITILTMLSVVLISYMGMSLIPLKKVEKYTHALAGASIFMCGVALRVFGL